MLFAAVFRLNYYLTMLSQDVCLSISPSVRLSVCLSVCLAHTGILSKQLNISSNLFSVK